MLLYYLYQLLQKIIQVLIQVRKFYKSYFINKKYKIEISKDGKVTWKKKIDQPILGKISQIDIYKNGRLQLVFNTKNKIYVLDRNGNNVKQFPKTFNDAITQPMAVFDYDNNKNYRLLITQGNELLMYDKNGKKVNGFKYKKSSNDISSKPKHFRILNKDFIVFKIGNI